jgi:thimet oligopeptidase
MFRVNVLPRAENHNRFDEERETMKAAFRIIVLAFALTAVAHPVKARSSAALQPSVWAAKPDLAGFDKSVDEHLAAANHSVQALVAVKGQRTVDNTLQPFDDAVREINTAAYLAGLIAQVHPDATFRDHATAATVRSSAALTAIQLNPDVYQALASIDLARADAETKYYMERQRLLFRLAGVDKSPAVRAELKKLNDALTEQISTFDRNISDDERHVSVTPAELDGMPADYIARHPAGGDGKVTITTAYPDALPVFTFAKSAGLRRQLSTAFDSRAYPKNKAVLADMLKTRERIAALLGYSSWTDFFAADKMIGTGAHVGEFIASLAATARPLAEREYTMILAEKRKVEPEAKGLTIDEISYYKELVRRSTYDFDSQSVRPYFAFERVKQGLLDTAATLFQVSFERERDTPAWDPAVESWLVRDHGRVIGRIYFDLHPRTGKFSHAEMAPILDGVRGRQLPEAILVCNFPAPSAGDPALMTYENVVTFFHEFGHLMHHILGGQQRWAGISGITMESDFVEAPSQMLEELIRSPQVLAGFARHYQTGEVIPKALVQRMNRASAFGRGGLVEAQLMFTAISYDLYRLPAATVDADTITRDDALRYTLPAHLPDTHEWAPFGHLGGYSSAYYTYLWDKIIALDFYQQFDTERPLSGDTAMRYRKAVLEPGGSKSANDLVRAFLGRPQNAAALERWIQAEFASSP